MKRLLGRPTSWLIIIPLLVLVVLAGTGRLQPRVEPDTQSYREFDWSSLPAVLGQLRTFGYPLFVNAAERIDRTGAAIPVLQWAVQTLAAWIFYGGLRAAGLRPWCALAATLPLFCSRSVLKFVPCIIGDAPAISLVVASAGCLFAALADRPRPLAVSGLALFTFLTYQVRPAYLFVIALWPGLAFLLAAVVFRRPVLRGTGARRGGLILAVCVIPFLAFCTLRWAVVGHWGLVSFGGYNIIGVTAQIIDQELANQLPDELRPLASEILRRRAMLKGYRPDADFLTMEACFSDIVWQVAMPATDHVYGNHGVTGNDAVTRLSYEVLRRKPGAYAQWLIGNAKHSVRQVNFLLLLDPGSALVFAVLLLTHLAALVAGPAAQRAPPHAGPETEVRFREGHLLLWTALAFAAAKTALVILVEPAIDRYMTGAITFLPPALAVYACWYVESVAGRGLVRPQSGEEA